VLLDTFDSYASVTTATVVHLLHSRTIFRIRPFSKLEVLFWLLLNQKVITNMRMQTGKKNLTGVVLLACFGWILAASGAVAQPRMLKIEKSTATYSSRDSLYSWTGTTSGVTGTLSFDDQTGELLKGEVEVDLASIDSGNGVRDGRMRNEFLQTDKFPKATLTIDKLEGYPKFSEWKKWGTKQTGKIYGQLTIHNVTRPVVWEAEAIYLGTELKVNAKGQIKMTDFGITPPSLAFITVEDNVGLQATIVAKRVEQP
jgi:polyisoprenoid-binding protein YceI